MTENIPGEITRLTERLLGPAGPEFGCEECFETLDAYVESELAGTDADAAVPLMRAHLQGCPACRSDHDGLLALLLTNTETRRRPRRRERRLVWGRRSPGAGED